MWWVQKVHLGRKMCIEELLVTKLSFQLNNKKNKTSEHFVELITQPSFTVKLYSNLKTETVKQKLYIFITSCLHDRCNNLQSHSNTCNSHKKVKFLFKKHKDCLEIKENEEALLT